MWYARIFCIAVITHLRLLVILCLGFSIAIIAIIILISLVVILLPTGIAILALSIIFYIKRKMKPVTIENTYETMRPPPLPASRPSNNIQVSQMLPTLQTTTQSLPVQQIQHLLTRGCRQADNEQQNLAEPDIVLKDNIAYNEEESSEGASVDEEGYEVVD